MNVLLLKVLVKKIREASVEASRYIKLNSSIPLQDRVIEGIRGIGDLRWPDER